MAALTADTMLVTSPRGGHSYPIANGTTLYAGHLAFAVRASSGIVGFADTDQYRLLGIVQKGGTGVAALTVEASVDESGLTLHRATVTGAASAADVGKKVFASGNDPRTVSLTPTANVGAIGRLTRWHTGTTCDYELFTPAEFEAMEATLVND